MSNSSKKYARTLKECILLIVKKLNSIVTLLNVNALSFYKIVSKSFEIFLAARETRKLI